MTPEQLAALASIATIIKTVGAMPLSLALFLIFVGPWLALIVVTFSLSRRSDKSHTAFTDAMTDQNRRFSAQIVEQNARMNKLIADQNARVNEIVLDFRDRTTELISGQKERFEAVVRMYENNVEMVRDYHKLADDLTGIITLTTRTLEALVQKVDNNMFCPAVREKGGK